MKTREILKNSIFVLAILVSVASWIYTNTLVEKLKEQEQKNISLWAEAMREIETALSAFSFTASYRKTPLSL